MALELVLRLELSEKALINDFCSVLEPNPCLIAVASNEEVNQAFSAWRWTQQVRSELSYVMTSEEVHHFHGGERGKMMDLLLTRLPSQKGWGDSLYNKFSGLLAENVKFLREFANSKDYSVSVIPKRDDLSYWNRLSNLYRSRMFDYSLCSDLEITLQQLSAAHDSLQEDRNRISATLSSLENLMESEGRDISSADMAKNLIDQKNKLCSQNEQLRALLEEFTPDKHFDVWSLIRKCSIYERASHHRNHVWEGLTECGFYEHHVATHLGFQPKGERNEAFAFEDPTHFIEFIPWDDLKSCNSPPTPSAYKITSEGKSFVKWSASKGLKFEHHLHPNEAIYSYCIESVGYLPGHMENGHIVFSISPLADSNFVEEIHHYWHVWVSDSSL